MSKKQQERPILPPILPKVMRQLIETGLAEQRELRHELTGGLILKFRPPDDTNPNCRLLTFRLDVLPSAIEMGVVKRELDKLVPSPVNGPGEGFWRNNLGCFLFSWSPDPQKVQMELF